ncbi:ATP-binding protein [Holophaga foetida]|uniref:ATP-binding protein n=1 Tax=Holophaga foetida TaxID=35839 RepID=UPI0002473F48|nr:4Fe-4S binding protein [Holophaga foetida]
MERQIIRIDEDKCNGCGQCAQGCPEGALQMIDGKARLVSEITCDGLGACIGDCPVGAISVETREAAPYDECLTLENILPKGANTLKAHLKHLHEHSQTTYLNQALDYLRAHEISIPEYKEKTMHEGCPGSAPRTILRDPIAPQAQDGLVSQLTQWPVQMHLISPANPVFHGADLLLAADCVAFTMADFNQRCLPGKKLAIACPKLDQGQEVYTDKLVGLIDEAQVNTITVMIMEVPCCGGLLRLAQSAAAKATRKVPIKVIVVGIDGEIRQESWV